MAGQRGRLAGQGHDSRGGKRKTGECSKVFLRAVCSFDTTAQRARCRGISSCGSRPWGRSVLRGARSNTKAETCSKNTFSLAVKTTVCRSDTATCRQRSESSSRSPRPVRSSSSRIRERHLAHRASQGRYGDSHRRHIASFHVVISRVSHPWRNRQGRSRMERAGRKLRTGMAGIGVGGELLSRRSGRGCAVSGPAAY